MTAIVADLRYAMRSVRRRPLLFAVASTVLALAIGASTAVFSVVDAVLLRPLPFQRADRLVLVWEHNPEQGKAFMEVSYADQAGWKSRSLTAMAAMGTVDSEFIIAGREPVRVMGRLVSGNFFDVLGARAWRGRPLTPDDDRPESPRVMVVSHGLWQRRFGADPALVGRSVVMGDTPVTVVGVMPPDFAYPPGTELWMPVVPAAPEAVANRGLGWMVVLGRLADGVSPTQARLELDGVISALWAERYAPEASRRAVVTPLLDHLFGPARTALVVFLGAVLLVLLCACANICALLLAGASARRREIAVRLALGASRGRLARQLLAEAALIAAAGGLAGLLLARAGLAALVALVPAELPRLQQVALDGRVLAFGFVLTALSAVAAGLVPALVSTRPALTEALGAGARLASPPADRRARVLLIAAETAAAVVLLFGAGLLVQTFRNLQRVPLGFDPQGVLTLEVSNLGAPGVRARYPRPQDLYATLLERIDALPGVVAAAAVSQRPLLGQTGYDWPVTAEGQSDDQAQRNPIVNLEQVTPRYFEAMRIALLRGRAFTEHDHERAPGVVVVSRNLAQHYWPGQDALGKRLKIPLPGTSLHYAWLTVVGVVGEVRYRELQAARPDLYISYRQGNLPLGYLVVRSDGDPAAPAASLPAAIRSVDPQLVVNGVLTMPAVVGGALGGARFGMQLASTFAAAALALAALGIYGVVAFVVGRRTREIGVRMALGARRRHVMTLVLGQGMAPALAGLLAGSLGALALGRALRASLFGVTAHEPILLAAAAAALTTAALLACALPAWRAARTDPARALREE